MYLRIYNELTILFKKYSQVYNMLLPVVGEQIENVLYVLEIKEILFLFFVQIHVCV